MNLRKFLLGFAFVMLMTTLFGSNSSYAVSKFSKAKKELVAKVESLAEDSGDKAVANELKEKLTKDEEKVEDKLIAEKTSGEEKASKEEPAKEAEKVDAEEPAKEAKKASGEEPAKEEKASEDEPVKEEKDVKEEPAKEDEKKAEPEKKTDKKANALIKDIDEDDWYFDYVEDAVDEKLMEVNSKNEFKPMETTTKRDVAVALYRIATRDDKKADEKEVDAYEWASKHSIMKTRDNADDEVTREEVAKYVYRYARTIEGEKLTVEEKARNKKLSFKDEGDISTDAHEAMIWCSLNKVFIGRPDNTVDPITEATRAESATVFVRLNDTFANAK
jgi:hypothetical protein